jgi:hypothetical protein
MCRETNKMKSASIGNSAIILLDSRYAGVTKLLVDAHFRADGKPGFMDGLSIFG